MLRLDALHSFLLVSVELDASPFRCDDVSTREPAGVENILNEPRRLPFVLPLEAIRLALLGCSLCKIEATLDHLAEAGALVARVATDHALSAVRPSLRLGHIVFGLGPGGGQLGRELGPDLCPEAGIDVAFDSGRRGGHLLDGGGVGRKLLLPVPSRRHNTPG